MEHSQDILESLTPEEQRYFHRGRRMVERYPKGPRYFSAAHRAVFRLTRGSFGGTVLGSPIGLLTTTGRRTGRSRTVPVISKVTLTQSPNPVANGGSVVIAAMVTAVAPGGGTPTGTIQFRPGRSNVGSPVRLTNGLATLPVSKVTRKSDLYRHLFGRRQFRRQHCHDQPGDI